MRRDAARALDEWLSDSGYLFRFAGGRDLSLGVSRWVRDDAGAQVGVLYTRGEERGGRFLLQLKDDAQGLALPTSAVWVFYCIGSEVFALYTRRIQRELARWCHRYFHRQNRAGLVELLVPRAEVERAAEYVADIDAGDGCVMQPRADGRGATC